mmetsp:Transcript_10447/g.13215  ORF Transcript_10447/g.13215 Transcript_10447/m.13215 type:complete len:95 (-) Transcript_10447:111-395(-)
MVVPGTYASNSERSSSCNGDGESSNGDEYKIVLFLYTSIAALTLADTDIEDKVEDDKGANARDFVGSSSRIENSFIFLFYVTVCCIFDVLFALL